MSLGLGSKQSLLRCEILSSTTVGICWKYKWLVQREIVNICELKCISLKCIFLFPPFSPCEVCLGASMQLCGCMGIYVWREEQCLSSVSVRWGASKRQCPCSPRLSCIGAVNTVPKKNMPGKETNNFKTFSGIYWWKQTGYVVYMWWGWHLWLFR